MGLPQQNEVKLFINDLGGAYPVTFWMLFVGGLLLCHTVLAVQTLFMGYWAEQYDIYPPEQVNITLQASISHYLVIFVDGYWLDVC
jgi:hypothetical protein